MASRSRDHGIAVERKLKLVPHEHDNPMLTKNSGPIGSWLWIGAVVILAGLTIYCTFGLTNILNWFASLI